MLTKKAQGVDFYKYYTKVIESGIQGDRGKWINEFDSLHSRLKQDANLLINQKNILDLSGEPGFFGFDAKKVENGNNVVVTAFAEEVAQAMKDKLDLESYKFDFNNDTLSRLFTGNLFDIIFVRYAIGFCEDLKVFLEDCIRVMEADGYLYISFSPASRGVCARWMFDDYTYLKQYTRDYMIKEAQKAGFTLVKEWDDGSYIWDKNLHTFQKYFSKKYIDTIFVDQPQEEYYQHNIGILLKKEI
jgi:ubiquinone/menaquinone biosynthesis C-methylase UbiE